MTNPYLVASRLLHDKSNPSSEIKVSLFAPYSVTDTEWACKFTITGIGEEEVRIVRGLDAFQALFNCLQVIRDTLSKTGKTLTWLGNNSNPGFHRVILDPFGGDYEMRINEFVDAETTRLNKEIITQAKEKMSNNSF